MAMDKMEAHLRQQLSAMMDGELASEEARFLFRRLQHDRELAGCWERWQICSVVLRGQGEALLPADFSQRVARALADDAARMVPAEGQAIAATGSPWRHRAWWGGGAALAASLALLAVASRPAPGPAPADAQVATTRAPIQSATPSPRPVSPDTTRSPSTPPGATVGLATALAVADAPRRAAARRNRSNPGARRTAAPSPTVVENAAEGTRVAMVEPQPSMNLPSRSNPFAQEPAAQPWPRAVLPGANTGAFTTGYSTGSTASFYPFEPRDRSMPEVQQAPAGGSRP